MSYLVRFRFFLMSILFYNIANLVDDVSQGFDMGKVEMHDR